MNENGGEAARVPDVVTSGSGAAVQYGSHSEQKSVSPRTYRVTFEGILQVEATDFRDAAMKAYDILAKMGAPVVQANPRIAYKYPEKSGRDVALIDAVLGRCG